jgi:hypothetical protein
MPAAEHPRGGTTILSVLALIVLATMQPAAAQDSVDDPANLAFQGYPEAPEFSVVPRKENLTFYPCTQCHEFMEPDPTIRELMSPHEIELNHGAGRIWCTTCHNLENRDSLTTTLGATGDFDDAHYLCGTCHSNRHRDWYFGAHGKRVANWQGERELYSCTHCHDAHDPTIKPREPQPPPGVRIGLEKPETRPHASETAWERRQNDDDGDEP